MLIFDADCVRTIVELNSLPAETRAQVMGEVTSRLPKITGDEREVEVFDTFTRAYSAWMRGGRRVYHIDADSYKAAQAACYAGRDLCIAPIKGAMGLQLDTPFDLGNNTWYHGCYLWFEETELWYLPIYGGFRFEESGPSIGQKLQAPVEDPLIGPMLIMLAALQDERVGRVVQWHSAGLRAQRLAARIPAARRRLIFKGDHTLATTRAPSPDTVPTAPTHAGPPAPSTVHLVAAHQGLRWMREQRALAELGEDAVLDAIGEDRYREVGTALYVAVPRPIREHIRGKAPVSPVVEKVTG